MRTNDTIPFCKPYVGYAKRLDTMPRSCIREILSAQRGSGLISFGGGIPHDSCVPLDNIQAAFDSVCTRHGSHAFRYGASEGEPELRDYIASTWLPRFGLKAHADEILIVNGSQQALDLIGKVFVDPGSAVAVERPTYLAALQAFSAFEPAYCEVSMDACGPQPDSLKLHLQTGQCRFFYTIPSFQNPSGLCCTLARRKEIADVMDRSCAMLVEDDPYSEIYYGEKPPLPICTLLPGRAMLLGTFSKMIAPGLRLGWVWTKSGTMRHLITAKQAADLCCGRFGQLLLLETLRGLDLDSHLSGIRAVYKAKRDAMDKALHACMADLCTWTLPPGGMFFWLKLRYAGGSGHRLLERCIKNGVAFTDGASFFASKSTDSYLRLNFTQLCESEMVEGLMRMRHVIAE
jgi:2-aminoadipate transaminase